MSQINLNSAFDPLAPLQRWVTYTQTEILSPKEELRAVKEEEQSVRTPQQRQLDSVQVQLRDMDQRLSEVVDAVTELFNKQESVHEMLGHLLQGLNALKGQTQQQDPPMTHDHSRHAAVLLVVSLVKKATNQRLFTSVALSFACFDCNRVMCRHCWIKYASF